MIQDKVKDILLKYLPEGCADFSVIFTGKESRKVDGLYNRETQEILIHNRNFKSDNELIYTAFHELAHHIDLQDKAEAKRTHTQSFYNILNGIVDKAIENGDYEDFADECLDRVLEKGKEHTKLMKEYGKLLVELYDLCHRKNICFEDIVIRKTGLTAAQAKSMMKMYAVDVSNELTGDMARKVAAIKDPTERKKAEETKTLPQPKAKAPKDPEDEKVYLEKEKKRLEKQDAKIVSRIGEIVELLQGFEDAQYVEENNL